MTERLSSWDPQNLEARGIPSSNLINLYKRWGEGQLGTILTGNMFCEYDQIEAPGNAIIPRTAPFSGERFEAFKNLATEAKKHGSLIISQVNHPGRQCEQRIQKDPISASDIQLEGEVMGMRFAKPHPASSEELERIVEGFTHAAEYLYRAGYDGIQLHAAHGYLLAQFLTPSTNQRTDQYGGDLANRSRLIMEIAERIRARVPPSFMLGIKINSVEFQKGGFSTSDAQQLCTALEAHQFDFVELSGGTYEELAFTHKRESTKVREAFFLDFAAQIVPSLSKTKTFITGGFKTVGAMVNALKTVDGVGLARPVCQEPRLCADILSGKVEGAIKQRIDDSDFGLTNVAAGSLMRQIGRDEEPIDLSRQEFVEAFFKDVGEWKEMMSKDTGMYSFGYVNLEGIAGQEKRKYGVAY